MIVILLVGIAIGTLGNEPNLYLIKKVQEYKEHQNTAEQKTQICLYDLQNERQETIYLTS